MWIMDKQKLIDILLNDDLYKDQNIILQTQLDFILRKYGKNYCIIDDELQEVE